MHSYAEKFYNTIKAGSKRSAREAVPIIMEMLHPQSVVDVGCGVGTWLSVFKEFGVTDILGLDGSYVDRSMLQIPVGNFMAADLSKPITLDRTYDVVLSVEVAEHLPEACAKGFVDSLVKLGPVVLFAAAIPYQGGTEHVNEQWPEYWNNLFLDRDYVVVDCLRRKIWNNSNVEVWYRQNLLLYVDRSLLEKNELLREEREGTREDQLSLVHPALFELYRKPSLKQVARMLSDVFRRRGK